MKVRVAIRTLALGYAASLPTARGGSGERTAIFAMRDSLPKGSIRLRYGDLLSGAATRIRPDLVIGRTDGAPHELLRDVRGIEVGLDGTIYVLDARVSEVRVFAPTGKYLRTIARPGDGPGELTAANGIMLDRQGTLWVVDHGKWQFLGLSPQGGEVARTPMFVHLYGRVFDGTIDNSGRFWQSAYQVGNLLSAPHPGLTKSTVALYMKAYDRQSGKFDSTFLGERHTPTWMAKFNERSWSTWTIPFSPDLLQVADPRGGFWVSTTESYRIAKVSERGDTIVRLEVAIQPLPVTPDDVKEFVDGISEDVPHFRREAEASARLAPSIKPLVDQLVIDDESRLWVRRVVAIGELALYDVFENDGTYLGSVRLDFEAQSYFPPRIRDGKLYTVVRDSLDVLTVVRAPLPRFRDSAR
jgi:hypothetical protein